MALLENQVPNDSISEQVVIPYVFTRAGAIVTGFGIAIEIVNRISDSDTQMPSIITEGLATLAVGVGIGLSRTGPEGSIKTNKILRGAAALTAVIGIGLHAENEFNAEYMPMPNSFDRVPKKTIAEAQIETDDALIVAGATLASIAAVNSRRRRQAE